MRTTTIYLLVTSALLPLSGCLTSPEPFYQESDIVVDDRLVGTYRDQNDQSQSPAQFYIAKDPDYYHKGGYYVTVGNPACSMKFGAVLFQIGTNRFLDMVPIIEACDRVAAAPPSLIELLQSATIQPMHMAVRVDEVSTNGAKLSFVSHPQLVATANKFPDYFQPLKPGQLPRLVADTKRQREFLTRFGSDTKLFQPAQISREAQPSKQQPVSPR
jgi:hypothetical protein